MISTYFLLKSYIGPGGVFGGPGGGFRTGRSSGKAAAGTCAKKNTPRTTKTMTRTTRTMLATRCFSINYPEKIIQKQ